MIVESADRLASMLSVKSKNLKRRQVERFVYMIAGMAEWIMRRP